MRDHRIDDSWLADIPAVRTLRQSTVVARKEYSCVCCPGKIKSGQKHWYFVNVEEGQFKAFRSHIWCHTEV